MDRNGLYAEVTAHVLEQVDARAGEWRWSAEMLSELARMEGTS
jgi:hypothetical protein